MKRRWNPKKMPERTLGHVRCCATKRRRTESNRRMEVLQTSALPLGYGAGAGNVTRYLTFFRINTMATCPSVGPYRLPVSVWLRKRISCTLSAATDLR
jgi:hypothetical protein